MRYLALLLLIGCAAPDRELQINGEWVDKPHSLEFCDDLRVPGERVLEQANWFHEEISSDYPFFTWDDVYWSKCNELIEPGVVRVQRSTFGEVLNHGATAWAQYSWESMVVEDPPGSYNTVIYMDGCTVNIGRLNTKWVIRHEFGHCWGWDHTANDDWTHLMSPYVGHDTAGLEYVPSETWTY
jgi:hypothetical protein